MEDAFCKALSGKVYFEVVLKASLNRSGYFQLINRLRAKALICAHGFEFLL
jgi:hypothetical protein